MKIFLIGGTGLLGSYLLPRLIASGHEVYALTRDVSKIGKIGKIGAYGILGDIRNPLLFRKLLPGKPELIILVAMPGIRPGERMTKARKEELRSETNDFFRKSIYLAASYNCPLILPGGTSYRTENNVTADETWTILRKGLTEIGADTDKIVGTYPEQHALFFGRY